MELPEQVAATAYAIAEAVYNDSLIVVPVLAHGQPRWTLGIYEKEKGTLPVALLFTEPVHVEGIVPIEVDGD